MVSFKTIMPTFPIKVNDNILFIFFVLIDLFQIDCWIELQAFITICFFTLLGLDPGLGELPRDGSYWCQGEFCRPWSFIWWRRWKKAWDCLYSGKLHILPVKVYGKLKKVVANRGILLLISTFQRKTSFFVLKEYWINKP